MSERNREREDEERQRRRVKITDKRRVRLDENGPKAEEGPERAGSSAEPEAGAAEEHTIDPRGPVISSGTEPVIGVGEPAREDQSAQLEAARKQAEEYREHLQRLAADFDNYRKRVLKEQTRAIDMAAEPLVRRLLEVLDEFELALMHAEQRPDFDRFLHGVELVYAKLKEILRSEGLQPIEATGKPFDPGLHEALMQSGEGEGEPVVVDVLRQGYTMKGRVIRPAGVKVARR